MSKQSKLHMREKKKHDDACLNTAVMITSEQMPYYLASRDSVEVRSSSTKGRQREKKLIGKN